MGFTPRQVDIIYNSKYYKTRSITKLLNFLHKKYPNSKREIINNLESVIKNRTINPI